MHCICFVNLQVWRFSSFDINLPPRPILSVTRGCYYWSKFCRMWVLWQWRRYQTARATCLMLQRWVNPLYSYKFINKVPPPYVCAEIPILLVENYDNTGLEVIVCWSYFVRLQSLTHKMWIIERKGRQISIAPHCEKLAYEALRYGSHSCYTLQTHHTCLYIVSVHQTAPPLSSDSSHLIASAYYSFIYPRRMKGWVNLAQLADLQQTVYPYKWLPINCRSGVGQGKFAGQRPTF